MKIIYLESGESLLVTQQGDTFVARELEGPREFTAPTEEEAIRGLIQIPVKPLPFIWRGITFSPGPLPDRWESKDPPIQVWFTGQNWNASSLHECGEGSTRETALELFRSNLVFEVDSKIRSLRIREEELQARRDFWSFL